MPKVGMEPIRRAALIEATISEIAQAGSLDVTMGGIARRAGVSSGLAHHYFGGKDDLLLAAMRHILRVYGLEVRQRLSAASTPYERLVAVVEGAFAPSNFGQNTVSAWLNFYLLALSSEEASRLHRIYRRRLTSNLAHALRPLVGARASDVALRISALIDGLYLHHGLAENAPDGAAATQTVLRAVEKDLA